MDAFVSLIDGLLALGLPGRAGARVAVQVTVPAELCDLEHEQAWPDGRTDERNVDATCRFHHRVKQGGWVPRRQGDGSTLWWSRAGARYRSQPPTEPPPTPDLQAFPATRSSATVAE